uniref:3-hydroxybutyryl-CoA dehydrogenase n=1 Tax=Streptomyces sp. MG11 TaxID=1460674 RepID=A0A0M7BGH4_9ACTN|nr:3-hydroxybutyryl-CoA dehydrogenase [Streptomyces sp. MG11]
MEEAVVGVVGLGTVGEALLGLLNEAGCRVVGVDRDLDVLARVEQRLKARGEGGAFDQPPLALTSDIGSLAGADFVIEAVDEDLAVKSGLLHRLHGVCADSAVFLTTTASLPLFRLATASRRPERTVGLRLLRPPAAGGRADVVPTSLTSGDAIGAARELTTALGLEPAAVEAQAGRFATGLVHAFVNRAAVMVAQGFVAAQDIDTAMRLGCGLPSGPLQLIDELGVDEVHAGLTALCERTGDSRYRPAPLLSSMLDRGTLGRKSGQGFYRYDDTGRRIAGSDTPHTHGSSAAAPLEHVGVLGSGTMARGIAEACAVAGFRTTLVARSPEKADAALAFIEKSLAKAVRRGKVTPAGRAHALTCLTTADDMVALADCDLVIEAVAEDLPLKRSLFARLGRVCRAGALLATTTSSLPVAACTEPAGRPEDTLGLHFFNPAPVMKLVELVRTPATGERAVDVAHVFCGALGKVAVGCPDRAGFIVNHLLFPYLADAVRLLDEHAVDAADIDAAMERGFGYPMGPYTLLDSIGLDVSLAILRCLDTEFPKSGYEPPVLVEELVDQGILGRKSGRGIRGARERVSPGATRNG